MMFLTLSNSGLIPLMLSAAAAASSPLRILASPWSPPAWLKVPMDDGNQTMLGSASPNGLIDDDKTKTTWANYISAWVSSYEKHGVKISFLTPQNEAEVVI